MIIHSTTMSNLKKALKTKGSKEAIGDFWVTLLSTGSADKGFDSMVSTAKRNGSLKKIQVGLVTDVLDEIF